MIKLWVHWEVYQSNGYSRPGLYANIHAKKKANKSWIQRAKMRKRGTKGSPTKKDFRRAAKSAMKRKFKKVPKTKKGVPKKYV